MRVWMLPMPFGATANYMDERKVPWVHDDDERLCTV